MQCRQRPPEGRSGLLGVHRTVSPDRCLHWVRGWCTGWLPSGRSLSPVAVTPKLIRLADSEGRGLSLFRHSKGRNVCFGLEAERATELVAAKGELSTLLSGRLHTREGPPRGGHGPLRLADLTQSRRDCREVIVNAHLQRR